MGKNIFIGLVLGVFSVTSIFGLGIRPGIKAGYINMSTSPTREICKIDTLTVSDKTFSDSSIAYSGLFGELSLDVDLLMGIGFGLGIGYANASHAENNGTFTVSSIRVIATGNFSKSIIPGIGYYLFAGPVISLDKLSISSGVIDYNGNLVTNLGINTQAGLNISLIPVFSVGAGVVFDYMLKSGSKWTLGSITTETEQSQKNLGLFLKLTTKII